jgi:hypothetical protein
MNWRCTLWLDNAKESRVWTLPPFKAAPELNAIMCNPVAALRPVFCPVKTGSAESFSPLSDNFFASNQNEFENYLAVTYRLQELPCFTSLTQRRIPHYIDTPL